jgi:hypothetical protein
MNNTNLKLGISGSLKELNLYKVCEYVFETWDNLKDHITIHEEKKPFHCGIMKSEPAIISLCLYFLSDDK